MIEIHIPMRCLRTPRSTGKKVDPITGSSGPHLPSLTLSFVSWAARMKMSHNFMLDYCDELYAIVTQDWIEQDARSPSGFDLTALRADFAAL